MTRLLSLEHDPCGDYISRNAVLDLIADYDLSMGEVVRGIHDLPSITPQPKKCGDCISRKAIIGKCEDTAKATSESGEINTGFIMALDFIADYAKHMPSVEPEQKVRECASCKHSNNGKCAYTEKCHECMWEIQYEQKIETERKKGKWLSTIRHCRKWIVCSQCGEESIYDRFTRWNYCPNCGADMKEGDA